MRLCAIYNVWADWDLLHYSVENIRPVVDGIIIIGSNWSNYGEHYPIPEPWASNKDVFVWEPSVGYALHQETAKRNFGLTLARSLGYSHFITMDSDEFYDREQFTTLKDKFHGEQLKGLVVPCEVLFAKPTLSIGRDITLVPFIHELTHTIKHDFNRNYPYAWINGQIRIDPTRSLNINTGVEYTEDITMIHASWVRDDYHRKIRNSTAKANLERSTILQDLVVAKDGKFCNYYQKRLYTVENRFNIPDYGEDSNRVAPQQNSKPVQATDSKVKPRVR